LIDEVKTFAIAGSDTTSNFITAMLLYIYEKPAVLNRLLSEIN
jgi:cytochrome P450